ncbi:MAG: EAL domain-containing protein, partial [Acidimicrobiales bacterium]
PLTAHGIDTSRVIIEVTESAVLEELHVVAAKIQRLRDVGIKVAIDDFGTGYTSLAHLRSLPIDILKIDRSFTMGACDDPHARSIVKLIIDIGHLLGARITAEGIETVEQAQQLTGMGADELQGFYYAKPVPADQVAASIERTLQSVSNAR